MNACISIVYYTSKTLSNGEHPLMLRISKDGKKKYSSIGVSIHPQFWDFTKNQPKRSCPNRNAILRLITEKTKQYQEQLIEFKVENKDFTATTLIQKVDKPTKHLTVGELFLKQIERLNSAKRIGYALSYKYVYKALLKFNGHLDIYFSDIDIPWLKRFEEWQRNEGASLNTIGIRFRTLRAIYNTAIEQGYVKPDYYPFKSYKVSKLHSVTAKRAITKDNVTAVINYDYTNKGFYTELAVDLFTFSYFMGGINFVDMAYITHSHIIDNRLVYTRTKTHKLIKLPLQPKAVELIQKYQTKDRPYIFPILSAFHKTEQQQRNRIHKVITKVNKHLKDIGEELNLPIDLTTYVARHSFATVLKRSGVNTSIICEAMGHSSEKVTQIYLDSFENEQVDAAMSNLL
ncbi:site-specific integrase [Odoribacter sp. Z80]|uniref:site-specific integrase n=1 Tax=Odoribacter sp. Z80 TaxID=2304575 RepID=UPI00137A2A5D|nr:site-specific integrase [Odoribacter sp. Z80]NCE72493.1 site-specific integrase [Odoribacter sp. Z80]